MKVKTGEQTDRRLGQSAIEHVLEFVDSGGGGRLWTMVTGKRYCGT
jgi:hypothetical protein